MFLPQDTIRELLEHETYLERLQDSTCKAREIARDCLQQAQVRQKRLYDINVLQNKFQVRDLVHVLNTGKTKGKCPKLLSIHNGPFVVTKIYGPIIYDVRNHKQRRVPHHDKLKCYTAEFIPEWMNRVRAQINRA